MSGKVMGAVWELDLPHSKQLILLAMADHADHEGNNVFASVGLIAWKTGYSERQVQRIMHECEADGLLKVITPATPRKPAVYRIDVSAGKAKAPIEKRQNVTPNNDKASPLPLSNVTPEVTPLCHPRGDTAESPEPYSEPSIEPSDSSQPLSRVALQPSIPETAKVMQQAFQGVPLATADDPAAPAPTPAATHPLPTPEQVAASINANAPFEVPDGYEVVSSGGVAHLRKIGQKSTVCGHRPGRVYSGVSPRPAWHRHQCQECHDRAAARAAPKAPPVRKPKADVPPPDEGVMDALVGLCYPDIGLAWKMDGVAGRARKCYNKLAKCCAPITPDKLQTFTLLWNQQDFRGKKGQRPTFEQIPDAWLALMTGDKPNGSSTQRTVLEIDHNDVRTTNQRWGY